MTDHPTDRLYYTDALAREFTATVVDQSDDGRRVYLDRTAFYPTSGGQPHDLGTLGGVPVVDVVDEDDRVAHLLAAPLPSDAREVAASVDWTRRWDHMQQHTGQHLLSAVLEDLFGHRTVSVHFGAETSTLDVDAEQVRREDLLAAERRANAIVGEGRPVTVSFEEAAAATGLRKPSDRTGTLRIVSIDRTDRSACGGTHVRTTAEIGPVLIRATEKVRKGTRIEFLCGDRALARARRDYETLAGIAATFSAALDDAPAVVAAQGERFRESESARRKLEKELAGFTARARYDAAAPDGQGNRPMIIRDAGSMDELRAIAQAAFALSRAVVIGALADPPSVLVATSEDSGVDAGRTLKAALAAVGGRGGGSPRLAQGSVPSAAAIDDVIARLSAPPA